MGNELAREVETVPRPNGTQCYKSNVDRSEAYVCYNSVPKIISENGNSFTRWNHNITPTCYEIFDHSNTKMWMCTENRENVHRHLVGMMTMTPSSQGSSGSAQKSSSPANNSKTLPYAQNWRRSNRQWRDRRNRNNSKPTKFKSPSVTYKCSRGSLKCFPRYNSKLPKNSPFGPWRQRLQVPINSAQCKDGHGLLCI